jgi:hypothetical protein
MKIHNQKAIQKLFKLRACFDYSDGRSTFKSQWDRTDNGRYTDKVCYHAQHGNILRAYIEGKDQEGFTHLLFECNGNIFKSFKWLAITLSPISTKINCNNSEKIQNYVKSEGENVGLVLETTFEKVTLLCNGMIKREAYDN